VENFHIIWQQIYSGNYTPNFIKVAEFCRRYYKTKLFFPRHCVFGYLQSFYTTL